VPNAICAFCSPADILSDFMTMMLFSDLGSDEAG
jgi:hypothetical protein